MTVDDSTIKAALAAVEHLPGSRIFACHPGSKTPVGLWKENATRNLAHVEHLFSGEQLNLGLAIGEEIGVLDVEGPGKGEEKGPSGDEGLRVLVGKFGPLPPTVEVHTPSGGSHLYFKIPHRMAKQSDAAGVPNVEFRTGYHYMVLPPSTLADGRKYEWVEGRAPGDIELAELPPAWVEGLDACEPAARAAARPAASTQNAVDKLLAERRAERFKDKHLPEIEAILIGCAFMRQFFESPHEVSEPDWYAGLSIVGRCRDGEKLAHAGSKGHPKYDLGETQAKLQQALERSGPRTCADINSKLCRGCVYANHEAGFGPISLGYSPGNVIQVTKDVVYVNETEEIVQVSDRHPLKLSKFAKSVQHVVKKAPADQLLMSRSLLKVRKRDYVAGNDNLVVGDAVNTWRRDGVEPAEGDASILTDFLGHLIPDKVSYDHVLNYLAHLIQLPGIKIKHGMMITGPQGTGKSTLARLVNLIFGRNARTVSGSEFTGRFQERLVDCQFLHVEEAAHGEKFEAAERLKELVTAEWFGVEGKGRDMRDARTPRGIMLLTNHEAGVVLAGDDRRWFVAATCNDRMPQEDYVKVNAAIGNGSAVGAFVHVLMTRDLSGFNPNAAPPMTEAKRLGQIATATPLEATLRRLIENGEGEFSRDLLTMNEIVMALRVLAVGLDLGKLTEPRVQVVLRRLAAEPLGAVRVAGGKVSPWAIRGAAQWKNAEAASIGRAYVAGKSPGRLIALPHIEEAA